MRFALSALAFVLCGASPGLVAAQSVGAFPDPPKTSRPAPPSSSRPAPAEPTAREASSERSPQASAAPSAAASFAPASGSAPTSTAPVFGGTWGGGTATFGLGPSAAGATPGEDVPPGYELRKGPATTPLVIGGVALGVPYATGLGIAVAEGFENGSGWLAAPVAGPWLALAGRRDPCATLNDGSSTQPEDARIDADVGKCVAEPMVRGLLVLDGVLQAAGGVFLIISAATSEERLVKKEPRVMAAPTPVGRDGYGVSVAGMF